MSPQLKKNRAHEVYAYGIICPSRLIVLEGRYPGIGQYAEMRTSLTSLGGEAANCAIVLGALGIRVKLDGNWLGKSRASTESLALLSARSINIDTVQIRDFEGPDELVIASGTERTIFGRYAALGSGKRKWNLPNSSDIQRAKVVCIDPFFRKESNQASRLARKFNVPYVTVDAKPNDPIIRNSDVAIISGEFKQRAFPRVNVKKLFSEYQKKSRGLVIFTAGEGEIMYGDKTSGLKTYKPPRINPIDTSGAGDSFRAGVVLGLLNGWTAHFTIRFASALAGLNCLRFPGVLNSPSFEETMRFMKRKRY